jgi:hypothetical protein
MDVVRAARICSAGHGGQILLSETTRALVGNNVPDGVSIRDLGEAHLKDIQHERIYELSMADQPGAHPPLKTSAPKTAADDLAAQIERKVHEQILAGFEIGEPLTPPRPPQASTTKLAKLSVLGLFNLVLLVIAVVAIILIVRAVL